MNQNNTPPLQVAYCTDEGYLEPTLVSLFSLLRRAKCDIDVHLVTAASCVLDWDRIEKLIGHFAHARLFRHILDGGELENARGQGYISKMAFARLLLPDYMNGRALYIDCDTVVLNDVSSLQSFDMKGKMLGVVHDDEKYNIYFAKQSPDTGGWLRKHERRKMISKNVENCRATKLPNLSEYFNSGVIFFDLEAIKANPDIERQMKNISAASSVDIYMDQDWLNMVFQGHLTHMSLDWNVFANPVATRKCFFPDEVRRAVNASVKKPTIVHFTGRRKPWNRVRISQLNRNLHLRLKYKREMRDMAKILAK